MLSYRHAFHAGNHADVLKHAIEALIIAQLKSKDKPFCYLDSHAGGGCYDLSGEWAQKKAEYLDGIARLWPERELWPELADYFEVIATLNESDLRFYPGSPEVARHLLREQDKLLLMELHNQEIEILRRHLGHDPRTALHHRDGFEGLLGLLPPTPRRGMVLIDPPYEIKTDYQAVVTGIHEGYKRFATGTYALWYPVVLRAQIKRMIKDLEATGIRKILQIELAVRPDSDQRGMTASGMIVINPPWKLEAQMNSVLPWLHKKLVPTGIGHATVSWIVPE